MNETSTIADLKKDMRRVMKARRAVAAREAPNAAYALCNLFLKHIQIPSNAIIASYAAMDDEIGPAPLVASLRTRGHTIALPVVAARATPLVFRAYRTGDALGRGGMGMAEPLPDAPEVEPDVLLVPMLAFDKRGYRLGYGGGYYDRTLQKLRAAKEIIAIGIAYAAQEVAEVPTHAGDARLDKIVTEIQVLSI